MKLCYFLLVYFFYNVSCINLDSSQEAENPKKNSNIDNNIQEAPKKVVFITGSTGVMGTETLNNFLQHLSEFRLKLLVRPSNKNKKIMKKILNKYNTNEENIEVIWGDLLNYEHIFKVDNGSDYVLNVGAYYAKQRN